ncbi:MAG TPA: hypothetical protein VFQ53_30115 [Kofleriaceae bacterium]|nr:hypothetical protein [Kofleriaceae bacterium]
MNRRVLLGLGAIAVLAAAVVLYLKLRSGGDDATATPAGTRSDPVVQEGSAPSPRAAPPIVADPKRPSAPVVSSTPREPGSASEPVDDYTVGGVRIRDHRAGEHARVDLPPNIHAPDSRRVTPNLTADLSAKLQAVMHECAANVPREARGEKPRLEGTIFIAIKDHVARVTEAAMQLRDVVGAAVDPTKQCIEQKAVGLTASAPEEADLDRYSISITFALL